MGISLNRTTIQGNFPVFWRGECKVLPGDFKLTDTLPDGTVIKKGTPIKIDFDNMQCTLCKAVEVVAGGTTTKPRIKKGSHVAVDETVGSQKISSIDTSNADYDELTLAASESTATTGAIIAIGSNIPDAVVERDKVIDANNSFNTVSAGYEVVILKDVAYPVADAWLTGYSMKNNPSIKYVRQ